MHIRERLIHWLARNLLPLVDEKQIITFKAGKTYIDNEELTQGEIINLRAEAHVLLKSRLWQVINANLNDTAQRKMYKEATDVTSILFAKTILYGLDIQKTIVSKCANLKN
jgi:hypothetical protein